MKFTLDSSAYRIPFKSNYWLWIFTSIFMVVWINTFLGTTDLNNWLLENTLTFLSLIFLVTSFRKYQFSDTTYLFVCIYLCMHVYGSKYTYAENPLGYYLQDLLHTSRNQYDRIVHFSFGFLLAYPIRELFIQWLKYPKSAAWITPIEITLSIGGIYELIEWAVADIFFTEQGTAYLGTQGDVWDAQKDIFYAFTGALLASTLISLIQRFKLK
jgi:putative membrane protein